MSIKFLSKTGLGMMASIAIPIGYMISQHITWMGERNQKIRMGLKHAGFWGGLVGTVVMGHKTAFPLLRSGNNIAGLSVLALGAVLPIVGYEASRRIAKWAFPSPQTEEETGLAHKPIPADLISNQLGNVSEISGILPPAKQVSPLWNGQQIPPQMPTRGADAYTPSYGQPIYNTQAAAWPIITPAIPDTSYNPAVSVSPMLPMPGSFLTPYSSSPVMRPYGY